MKRAKICLTLCVIAFAVNLSAATRFRAASPADPVIGRYEIVFSDTVLDAEAAATELARTYAARLEPFAGDSVAGAVMTMLPERARLMSSDPRVAMVTEIGTLARAPAGIPAPPRPGAAESMARPTTPRPHTDDAWSSGAYLYDAAGNIESIGSDTYAYDTALRVVAATTENQRSAVSRSQKYAYDSFGNRESSATTHTDASRCVNGTLCEETVGVDKRTNRINTNGAEYDAAGNLTRIDAAYSYAYDAVGMLFRQQTPGVTQFVYTAADERIAVYTAGRWEWSLRDHAGKVLRTFTSNDHGNERGTAGFTWTKDYVYRGSLLLASDAPSGRRHYHLDHLGTPRVITDDGGRKLGTHAYHAFGAEVPLSFLEQPQERLKFTGHERDLSPDIHTLDYMHARYYSAAMGRFMSVDPVISKASTRRPQMWNRYAYVTNNPINATDPTGRILQMHASPCEMGQTDCYTRLDAFQAVKDMLPKNAGKHLSMDKNGFVRLKGISEAAFAKQFGGTAGRLAQLMSTTRGTAHVSLSSEKMVDRAGGAGTNVDGPNAIVKVDPGATPTILGGVIQTLSTGLAHELGHAYQHIFGLKPESRQVGYIDRAAKLLGVGGAEAFGMWAENQYRQEMGLEHRRYYWYEWGDYIEP